MSSAVSLLSTPVEKRTRHDLIEMLRCAAKLEHATLPPYLTAWWSIKDPKHPAFGILETIVFEEMGHLGTVCNLLRAIGSTPTFTATDFVPQYPAPLPCNIAPKVVPPNVIEWKIRLSRLTPSVVSDVFMIIEYPEAGPIQYMSMVNEGQIEDQRRQKFYTIGDFYDAIAATLKHLFSAGSITIKDNGQLSEPFVGHDENGQNVLKPVTSLAEALRAIEHIKEQGEGTPCTPDAPMFGHELAHYYRFKQIQIGQMFAQETDGSWTLSGDIFDFPSVRLMADIPTDGYENPTVPQNVWQAIEAFNGTYKSLLMLLQSAWELGGQDGIKELNNAEIVMDGLSGDAKKLMDTPIDVANPAKGNYGPTFRLR